MYSGRLCFVISHCASGRAQYDAIRAGSVHGHFTKGNAHQQGYNYYVYDIVFHVCALRLVKPTGGDIPIVVQGPKCPN
jgi:hypothetical protein